MAGEDDNIIRLVREPLGPQEAEAEIAAFISEEIPETERIAEDIFGKPADPEPVEPLLDEDDPLIAAASLSARDVADYLRVHPDFFHDHEDLLETLSMPGRFDDGGATGVVDFQKVIIDQHKDTLDELRDCIRDVIETSRTNLTIQGRTHAAVLALLAANDLDVLLHVATNDLPLLLDVDVVAVGFEPTDSPLSWLISPDIRALPEDLTDDLVGVDRDAKLFAQMEDDGTLFGGAAPLVHSAALARLRAGQATPKGLLALGSRSEMFQPGQGTELVVFLARVLEHCIDRLQEPVIGYPVD